MKKIITLFTLITLSAVTASAVTYVKPEPLSSKVVSNKVLPVKNDYHMPVISWADVALAIDNKNLFPGGIKLVDNPVQQINDVIQGKTPFIRQTVGSGVMVVDTLNKLGIEMVVFHSVTDSLGADVIVSKSNKIKTLNDLKTMKNKGEKPVIAIQYGGPHMGWLVQLLKSVDMSLDDVTIKFVSELFGPNSPDDAIAADSSVDMAFVISPSASSLTSGEYAIPGLQVLTTTKVMNEAIKDVIYVRKDWGEQNKSTLSKIRNAYLSSTQKVNDKRLVKESATMLFGVGEQGIADFEGMVSETRFHNEKLSNKFLFSPTNPNNLSNKVSSIVKEFYNQGYIDNGRMKINTFNWDVQVSNKAEIKVLSKENEAKLERNIQQLDSAGQGQIIFKKTIYFQPNQSTFEVAQYGQDFKDAINLAATYGGAVLKVVGNVDPQLVRAWKKAVEFKEQGNSSMLKKVEEYLSKTTGTEYNLNSMSVQLIKSELNQVQSTAKTTSKERANSVKRSVIDYAKANGIDLDATRLVVLGDGAESPIYVKPKDQDEFRANMRVEFQITNYNAEIDTFSQAQDF